MQVGWWKDSVPYGLFQLYHFSVLKPEWEGAWNDWGDWPYKAVKAKKIRSFLVKERPPERPKKKVVEDKGPQVLDMFSSAEAEDIETEAEED